MGDATEIGLGVVSLVHERGGGIVAPVRRAVGGDGTDEKQLRRPPFPEVFHVRQDEFRARRAVERDQDSLEHLHSPSVRWEFSRRMWSSSAARKDRARPYAVSRSLLLIRTTSSRA